MRFDRRRLAEDLTRWADEYVASGARAVDIAPMPGNSGLSFGFDVVAADAVRLAALVIRLAPPGVRRQRNTDVLRQVPLLGALEAAGIPVAPLVWWSDDESWFGTDAIIQRRLASKPLHMTDASLGAAVVGSDTAPYLQRAAAALVAIHNVDWRRTLADWEPVRSPDQEIASWWPVVTKSDDTQWVAAAERLRDALLRTVPQTHPVGLFHGDYQTNNILFDPDDGAIVAIVDWEIAGLGPQLLDLGWLSMMTDPSCWDHPQRAALRVVARPADVLHWYQEAAGAAVADFDWHRALAFYRFGAIAAFNVRLHRTGRRVDATYERMASSVPVLFEGGIRLLGG